MPAPRRVVALLAGLIFGTFATLSAAQEVTPPPPALDLASATYKDIPIQFGFQPVGADPAANPELVQVTNIGSKDLVISSITSTNPVFSVTNPNLDPISPGQTAGFFVEFAPTVEGAQSGYIVFTSNDAFNPEYRMPVQGTGIDVQITISPPGAITVPGEKIQFAAQVTGTPNTSLIWSYTGVGSVDNTGLYRAGSTTGTAQVTATSLVDPTKKATVEVSVVTPDITLPPDGLTGPARLGTRVISADLDQDGFVEVIASAPTATVATAGGDVPGAGMVWIREFGWQGFTDPPILLAPPNPSVDGHFGMALSVADYDGDGRPDLLVGEPDTAGGGSVYRFTTLADGTVGAAPAQTISVPGGVAGDRFGAAIDYAYLAGPSALYAVAADGTTTSTLVPYAAIGAPGTAVQGVPMAGAVHLVNFATGAAPSFPLGAPLTQATPQPGASFGESLAGACMDGCTQYSSPPDPDGQISQRNSLIVGAPGAAVNALSGAGKAFVLRQDTAADPPAFLPEKEVFNPFPAAGARFGHAVIAADLSTDLQDDVIVSAPGQPVPVAGVPGIVGAVYVYLNDAVGNLHFTTHLLPDAPSDGMRFGSSLAVGLLDNNRSPDLAVGTADPQGDGRVIAWLGDGGGDFSHMRRVSASGQTTGDGYGTGLGTADLNRDGVDDLVIGAPRTTLGGTVDSGTVYTVLYKTLPQVLILNPQATVARTGITGHQVLFRGSLAADKSVWDVVGPGTIGGGGVFTAPADIGDPILGTPLVRLRLTTTPDYWALARVRTVKLTSSLTTPELIFNQGNMGLGYPEVGANFGTALTAGHIGRATATDPDPDKLTVIAGYPTLNSEVPARFNTYPYFSDPANPFGAINPYLHLTTDPYGGVSLERDEFGRLTDAGSSWGMQLEAGDFNGDGFSDLAISAPFATLEGTSDPQVGYVDIWFMGADGAVVQTIRITPANMVDPTGAPMWTPSNLIANTRYGYKLLATDLDGNGVDDLVVGTPYADVGGVVDAGLVELLMAPADGDWVATGPTRATITETTPRARAYFGSALAKGDTTGDLVPELFVGAPGRDPRGTNTDFPAAGRVTGVAPLSWSAPGATALRDLTRQAPRMELSDPEPSPPGHPSGFGISVAVGNLMSDDPQDEVVVGVPYRTHPDPVWWDTYKGEAFKRQVGEVVVFDPAPTFDAATAFRLGPAGRQLGMQFGLRVAIGNFTTGGTGPATLVVGTPYADGPTGADSGAVFLYHAQPTGAPRFARKLVPFDDAAQAQFGFALLARDLDRDGTDELMVSAPVADVGVLLGYKVYPGRWGYTEQIIDTRKQTGKVYVIFPDRN